MKCSNREAAQFCEQLSMVLKAGLSIKDGLETIFDEVDDKQYKDVLMGMIDELDTGYSFNHALVESDYFDEYLIQMVDVGEKTGYLDNVLYQLSLYYYRLDESNSRLKEAITYPSILIIMMIVVMGIIVIRVLPVFQQVLNNLGTDLNITAITLMNIGQIIARYGLWVVLALIIIVVITFIYYKAKYQKEASERFLSNFFLTKRLYRDMSISHFAYAMSLFMNSGYDMEESIKAMKKIVTHPEVLAKVEQMEKEVDNGASIQTALLDSKIFKSVHNRLLVLGFKAGKLDETMNQIAVQYEDEVNNSIVKFLNMIEPILIGVSVIIIGVVLLSVMLPLMGIMSTIG